MSRVILARIQRADVGLGGPYNSSYGIHLTFIANDAVSDFWDYEIFLGTRLYSDSAPSLDEAMSIIADSAAIVKMLETAQVSYIKDLIGKPVRCEIDSKGELISWNMLDIIV